MAARLKSLLAIAVVTAFAAVFFGTSAHAVSASDFNPGRIIDDEIFYDKNAMSVADIQAFLNAHVPSCDTWGTQPSGYGNLSNAQYAQQVMGWPGPPYVCLNNYYENPSTGQTSFEMGGGAFSGGQSAAQIIYNAAQQYGISPKVLLITLRKESLNLFSDSWPMKSQYKYAMGYACPDSGPNNSANCDSQYAGFYNQVNKSAWQFRYYYDHMGSYNYAPGWNTIQYSTDPSCGTKDVYIQNYATASLYIYTPYTPNNAALNAYPGTAPCGAYGNRNFWYYWQEWFGTTYASVDIESSLSVTTDSTGSNVYTGMPVTAKFTIKNNTNYSQDIGTMAIAVRDSGGANYDFGNQRIVLSPHQSYMYTATKTFTKEDTYNFWITNYRDSVGWSDTYPSSLPTFTRSVAPFVQAAPTVETSITSDVTNMHVGQPANVSFTVKNNSTRAVNLGYFGLAMNGPDGRNADLRFDTVNALAAGQSYTYTKQFTPTTVGQYTGRISSTQDNGVTWSETKFPIATPASNGNRVSFTVKSNPTLTQGLAINTSSLRAGDSVTGTFKVKNFSGQATSLNQNLCYIIRSNTGGNYDLGCLPLSSIAAGQEVQFSASSKPLQAGTYSAYFSIFDGRNWLDNQTLPLETGSEVKSLQFTVKSNPTMTAGMAISSTNAKAGDSLTGTFKLKNFSTQSVTVNQSLCYIVRSSTGANYDLGCMQLGTFAAGEEKTFSMSRTFPDAGQYTGYFSTFDGSWHDRQSTVGETGSEPTSVAFTVKPNPTLSQGLSVSGSPLRAGDTTTGTFKIKNSSNQAVTLGKSLCYIIRSNTGTNYDLGCLPPTTVINAGQEVQFSAVSRALVAGTYNAYFSTFDGKNWLDNQTLPLETGNEAKNLTFTVQ